jgi:type I restriction enzyme S subunit
MTNIHPLFETPLPYGWQLLKVDDIKSPEKSACVAGPFGSSISSKFFVESGVPIIRGGNLRNDLTRFVPEGFAFVSEEQAAKYKAQHVRPGDLVFTCWGTIGQVGLIPKTGPYPEYIISNKQLKLRPNIEIADPEYLFFYFAGPKMVQHVQGKAIGAAVPGINLGILKELPVVLPPFPVQQRIAGILSAYDELIENCQRRIKILETMARALYREWFVHFRFPGHDNSAGQPNWEAEGHPEGVSTTDGANQHVPRIAYPLGEIPQGWEVKTLREIISSHIGGGWGKEQSDEEHTEPAWVIRGTDIPDARYSQIAGVPYRVHTVSNLRSRRLGAGDIVFEVSGGSKGQPVGRTLLITPELLASLGDDVICASFCKRIQPDIDGYGSELLYLSFLEGYESGEIEQYQVQSTGISNFKWTEYLANTNRVIPPQSIREEFRGHVAPLFTLVATLGRKIENLRRTRDLLLPRLLSGQINVEALEATPEGYEDASHTTTSVSSLPP